MNIEFLDRDLSADAEEGTIKVVDNDTLEAKGIARAEVSRRKDRGAQGKRLYLYGFDQGYQDITEVVISVGGISTSHRWPPQKKKLTL